MLAYERRARQKGFSFIVGVDEAGRGPLAGPVVAAAVALGKGRFKSRIDDSKKLTPQQRERAFIEITAKKRFGVGIISETVIDRVNILEATRLAMENAVFSLIEKVRPPKKDIHLLIDGNVKLNLKFPSTNIIKGDAKSKSIASASIVAKVVRDRIMCVYHKIYPQWGFDVHKGYPTLKHRLRIKKFGLSVIHRNSFEPKIPE